CGCAPACAPPAASSPLRKDAPPRPSLRRLLPLRPFFHAAVETPAQSRAGCDLPNYSANRFRAPDSCVTQGALCRVDQLAESRFIVQRHFRQNLAIQFQTRRLQTVQELAVAHARLAASRVDAHDPQRTIFALLVLPPDVGEFETALYRFLRGAIQFALCEEVTGRQLQRLFPACPAVCTTFNSWHV